jgi:transcriptional antiterminator NusG
VAEADETVKDREQIEAERAEGFRWYALQTYSGHENKVKKLIHRKMEEMEGEPEDRPIREVIVPTQEVVEIKGGKKVTKEKRLYPGYVLIQMHLDQETMYMIDNVQGVIRFLGGESGEPQPLKQAEINKILGISEELEEAGPEEDVPFHTGQAVEIKEGPFSDFSGTVEEVFHDKGKVRVQVSLFGRPTSVELDYTQLEGY